MLTVTEENILVNVEADSSREVIRILADLLVKNGCVTPGYFPLLISREEKYPTGLPTEGVHVAIPHACSEGSVLKPAIAIATLARSVTFKNMANKDEGLSVGIVFVLALADEKALAGDLNRVMGIFSEAELLTKIHAAGNGSEIVTLMSTSLAGN